MGTLQSLPESTTANCISTDGVVIGGQTIGAARWVDGDALTFEPNGEVLAMTPDGLLLAGRVGPYATSEQALWTFTSRVQNAPVRLTLGKLPGPMPEWRRALAMAMSHDASTIVGACQVYDPSAAQHNQPYAATLWTASTGLVNLNTYLPSVGVDISGWNLNFAHGISGNGRVVVGAGYFLGQARGFVLTLPLRLCGTADFNNDGDFGTDQDIEAFFACLGGNCCERCGGADFNADGDSGTDQDIEAFFRVLSGSPC